ncbi:MFS general substrate transporter [Gonapodya prolifera JEL478]|uniref:MFS general substrate transporter n=1 Tax=Gonapodya prolifera (strain JEL478) TaxID=1344416 RepID=A0A139AFU5_GONPJ|nr:MFS general substrate transporter [Gonapodya prolifera JEL478]|eukprot:KXS15692.1 MFS general substrate transporter [Gonapodya prolifera JEL478]
MRSPSFLASRTYALFVVTVGLFADVLSYSLVIPIMPFIFNRLSIGNQSDSQENSALVGVLLGSYAAAQLICSPLFGWVSDRISNRKWPMVWGLFAGGAAVIIFALATSFATLIIARVLQGVSAAAVWTLGLAFLGDVYPEEELGKAYGVAMTGFSVGTLIGLPIGGALYQYAGYWTPFIASAAFILCDMVARLLVVEKKPVRASVTATQAQGSEERLTLEAGSADAEGVGKDKEVNGEGSGGSHTTSNTTVPIPPTPALPTHSFRFPPAANLTWVVLHTDNPSYWDLARDPAIMTLNGLCAVAGIIQMSLEPTMPLYMEKEFGADSFTIGLIFLAMVGGGLFSGPVSGTLRDKYGAAVVVVPCLVMLAVVVPFLAVAKSYGTLAVVSLLNGMFMTAVQAPLISELVGLVPQKAVGKAFGLFNIAFSSGSLLGPLAAGAIYQVSTFLTLCLVLCGFSILLVPLYLLFVGLKTEREIAKAKLAGGR